MHVPACIEFQGIFYFHVFYFRISLQVLGIVVTFTSRLSKQTRGFTTASRVQSQHIRSFDSFRELSCFFVCLRPSLTSDLFGEFVVSCAGRGVGIWEEVLWVLLFIDCNCL